jgi:hypothetical protein
MKPASYSLEILTTSISDGENVSDKISRLQLLSETFCIFLKITILNIFNLSAI